MSCKNGFFPLSPSFLLVHFIFVVFFGRYGLRLLQMANSVSVNVKILKFEVENVLKRLHLLSEQLYSEQLIKAHLQNIFGFFDGGTDKKKERKKEELNLPQCHSRKREWVPRQTHRRLSIGESVVLINLFSKETSKREGRELGAQVHR